MRLNSKKISHGRINQMTDIANLKIMVDASQLDVLIAEIKAFREELREAQLSIAKNTGETAEILRKFDSDGFPESR